MHPYLSFAINARGYPVSVAEVPSGLAYGCTCPACGARLVAKKGLVRDHHFAHESNSACAAGYESAIHLAVKTFLEQKKQLLLPPCYARHERVEDEIVIDYPSEDCREHFTELAHFDYTCGTTGIGVVPSRLMTFDRVAVECQQEDVRPDIIGYFKDVPLYVEVAVTHFVDAEKIGKLRVRGASAVELDFSKARFWTWESIEQQLLASSSDKKWLINRVADRLADEDRLSREARTKEIRTHQDWPVTHESEFSVGGRTKIRIFLCPGFVGVQAKGDFANAGARKHFYDIMKTGKGEYDKRNNVWQFRPPSENLFIRIEQVVRANFQEKHGSWSLRLPPGQEARVKALIKSWP